MPKLYNLDAECHMQLKNGGYRVKLAILDHGLYINGIVVFPPNSEHGNKWNVYTPAAGKARLVEFNSKLPLWEEVKDACIDAVKIYRSNEETDDGLLDLPKEEFDNQYSEELDRAIKNLDQSPNTFN
jgi:hypothetical protein